MYDDSGILSYLQTGELTAGLTTKDKYRILQQAKRFKWEGSHLLRIWKDRKVGIVPLPTEREQLVRHVHEELGHFRVQHTHNLLQGQYWWRGMHTHVQQFVAKCMWCDRVRISLDTPSPQLHPLPIMGLGYRWSLDFAGPLSLTIRHNKYVLVMVEHFSK